MGPGQLQHQPGEAGAAAQVHQGGGAVQKRQHRQGVQEVLDDDVPVGLQPGQIGLGVPELELFQVDLQVPQGGGGQFQAQGRGALRQEGQGFGVRGFVHDDVLSTSG